MKLAAVRLCSAHTQWQQAPEAIRSGTRVNAFPLGDPNKLHPATWGLDPVLQGSTPKSTYSCSCRLLTPPHQAVSKFKCKDPGAPARVCPVITAAPFMDTCFLLLQAKLQWAEPLAQVWQPEEQVDVGATALQRTLVSWQHLQHRVSCSP
ncbi:hypothetical protein H920_11487 [Fukomys damarensis]|uniref:Uncharacterized protein n=1 Tax=Fukomys damarensis TaxID=885580 RepID=A0A091D7M8_FUKDA|nr:hypothetical protein H920_11487 [Fukomys damarensis]